MKKENKENNEIKYKKLKWNIKANIFQWTKQIYFNFLMMLNSNWEHATLRIASFPTKT